MSEGPTVHTCDQCGVEGEGYALRSNGFGRFPTGWFDGECDDGHPVLVCSEKCARAWIADYHQREREREEQSAAIARAAIAGAERPFPRVAPSHCRACAAGNNGPRLMIEDFDAIPKRH